MKARAAVILIQNDQIALIERHRSGRRYFVFPGGKIEADETPAVAAAREAEEELGVQVQIEQLVAEVWYLGAPQYYFLATLLGGKFGHGTGSEMSSQPGSAKGTYRPLWMPVVELPDQPVLPKIMTEFILASLPANWPEAPWVVADRPPDEI